MNSGIVKSGPYKGQAYVRAPRLPWDGRVFPGWVQVQLSDSSGTAVREVRAEDLQ